MTRRGSPASRTNSWRSGADGHEFVSFGARDASGAREGTADREGDEQDSAKWYWFEGNFESYEKNKVERLGADAARPHRVTYRKLTRD